MKKILLLGPMRNKKYPSKTGGIIVLFENLIDKLNELNISFTIIDTNKENYQNKLFALYSIYFQFLLHIYKHSHVSLHGTAKDYFYIAPFVIITSKILKKKVSLRKFAGNFHIIYNNSNFLKKNLLKYILKKSNVNFFETKYLVKEFKKLNYKTFWFPNVRNNTLLKTSEFYNKKFIFIGTLSKEKGIDTLLKTSMLLDKSFTIDLYGTLKDYNKNDFINYNVTYKGSLESHKVLEKMSEYDVLILPSLREGYPGVIIEAFSLGLPIIATSLTGIREMVNDKCSILIEKENINSLKRAMQFINSNNYINMHKAAINQFGNFNSDKQIKLFLKRISYDWYSIKDE